MGIKWKEGRGVRSSVSLRVAWERGGMRNAGRELIWAGRSKCVGGGGGDV